MRCGIIGWLSLIFVVSVAPTVDAQQARGGNSRIGDELKGTRWQAETVDGVPVADPAHMTVEFAASGDQVRGQAGCNEFVGPFASRGDKVTMGILRQTLTQCPPEQAAAQKTLIDMLHAAYQGDVEGNVLTFVSRQGGTITFVPLQR